VAEAVCCRGGVLPEVRRCAASCQALDAQAPRQAKPPAAAPRQHRPTKATRSMQHACSRCRSTGDAQETQHLRTLDLRLLHTGQLGLASTHSDEHIQVGRISLQVLWDAQVMLA
jgi:hypothetical protein